MTQSLARTMTQWAFALALAGILTAGVGCQSANRVDLLKNGRVRFEREPSRAVQLPEPSIWAEGDELVVSGRVRRWSQVSGILAGHVHVSVRSSDGREQDLLASLSPSWVPIRAPWQSSYTARSKTIPPPGAIVRVAYRNDEHP